jgi:WD40 repeat protein
MITSNNPRANSGRSRTTPAAALPAIFCLCVCAISAYAQDSSLPGFSLFQIQTGSVVLEGAALSPDGEQLVAAYFGQTSASPTDDVVLNVTLWNVGAQAPIARKQIATGLRGGHGSWTTRIGRPNGFAQYCDHGSGLMVADSHGTLYYLNPQNLAVLHATSTNMGVEAIETRVFCAADSSRAVIAAYGESYRKGPFGNGLIRVYDLASGALVHEWNMTDGPYEFGDVAISPSGNEIAVSHIPTNLMGSAKSVANLELFDVGNGKTTLQVKTGHLPGRISFVGEARVATADTVAPGTTLFHHPRIRLWDAGNGAMIREFGDPEVGARRFVGASTDGKALLGYIPKEISRTGGFDGFREMHRLPLLQRFRVWDTVTGQTIATSPPILPIHESNLFGIFGHFHFDPSFELSANGRAVLVFWKSPYKDNVPIYVFSEAPTGTR